jgi:hypothetical protein
MYAINSLDFKTLWKFLMMEMYYIKVETMIDMCNFFGIEYRILSR